MKYEFIKRLLLTYLLAVVCNTACDGSNQKPFVVIIPSYNNIAYCEKNIRSVFGQEYDNYRVIYVDDCSTDGTGQRVQELVKELGQQHRFMIVNNKTRRGAMANWVMAVWLCDAHEVVVSLDGDDWFAHERVLTYLDSVYQDPNVWMTYGQFIIDGSNQVGWCREIPQDIIAHNQFRDYAWVTSHLRSFYAGLFHGIPKEDFMAQGQFYPSAADLAIMYPLLERAGTHSRFVPEILYVYNRSNPLNDERVDYSLQTNVGLYIRAQKKHAPVERFDDATEKRTIYIQKGLWGTLFDLNSHHNRDNCLYPTHHLRNEMAKKAYRLKETSSIAGLTNAHSIVCFDVPMNELDRLVEFSYEKLFLMLWEPPSVAPHNYDRTFHYPFAKVATWVDNLVDHKKYHKMYYPVHHDMITDTVPFEHKKLATMIAFNKNSGHPQQLYTERQRLVEFYEHNYPEDFDIFGSFWPQQYRTFKGAVKNKVEVLKHYKFAYAYENIQDVPGYVTEKIFDVFWAGTVPVYWGANNIEQYVPKNCFINRKDFNSNEELYQYLKSMPQETYEQYLVNIKNYLASEQAQLFNAHHFADMFSRLVLNEPLSE